MKNNSSYLIFIFCWVLAACNTAPDADSSLIFHNNIDNYVGWNEQAPGNVVQSDNAHSGVFVNRINAEFPYSSTLNVKLGDVSKKPLKTIRVSGWVLMPDINSYPTLVLDFLDANKQSIEYIPKDARKEIDGINKWVKISTEINLMENNRNNPNNFLKVYFTNPVQEPCLVDDMNITFLN